MKSDLTFWDHLNWTGKGNYVNPPESLETKRAAHWFASRAMTRLQSQGFWCQSVQLLSGSEQSKAASRTDWPIVGRRSDPGFGWDALAAEPMVRPKKCGKMSYQSEPKGANWAHGVLFLMFIYFPSFVPNYSNPKPLIHAKPFPVRPLWKIHATGQKTWHGSHRPFKNADTPAATLTRAIHMTLWRILLQPAQQPATFNTNVRLRDIDWILHIPEWNYNVWISQQHLMVVLPVIHKI